MSAIVGSLPGLTEGVEAGFGVGAVSIGETNKVRLRNRIVGIGATAVGLVIGKRFGEQAAHSIEQVIGKGGTNFIPSVAVGSMMSWHDMRGEHRPDNFFKRFMKNAPTVLVSAFAGWEGIEAGILGGSAGANIVAIAATTATGFAVGNYITSKIEGGSKTIKPSKIMRRTRLMALIPPTAIAGFGASEFMSHPSIGGAVVAGVGAIATGGAVYANTIYKPPSHGPELEKSGNLESTISPILPGQEPRNRFDKA